MRDHQTRFPYRADIDGLRAVSVMAVVGFHALPTALRGGFIGVDVFFVISGFLITRILLNEPGHWTAGVRLFYVRRVRRLFPALVLVMGACFLAGWFLLLPEELATLGRHLLAGAGFASNFLSWSESGYFDTIAEKKILLHLWSLAIEEQFYLAWPLVVLVLPARWRRTLPVLLLAATSLAFALVAVRLDPVMAFFSPLTRAWELLAGASLAMFVAASEGGPVEERRHFRAPIADRLSVGGALLVLAGIVLARPGLPHPSWFALLPVLGACALIAAGPHAVVNRRLLARPWVAALGRISFPLYLWHWPLLAFAKVLAGRTPDIAMRVGLMVTAGLLAVLTWVFVERPVQRSAWRYTTPTLLGLMILVGLTGLGAVTARGWPQREVAQTPIAFPGDIGHDAFHGWIAASPNLCQHYSRFPYTCHQSEAARAKPTLAILGDSHAQHLAPALAERLPGMNVTVFGSMGLPGLDNLDQQRLMSPLLTDDRIQTTLVVAAWWLRVAETKSIDRWGDRLVEMIDRLERAGRGPILLEDIPHFTISPERCKFRELPLRGHQCTESRGYLEKQRDRYLPTLRRVARDAGVPLVEVADRFCDADRCTMQADGRLLYRDGDHLGIEGARWTAQWLTGGASALQCSATRCRPLRPDR